MSGKTHITERLLYLTTLAIAVGAIFGSAAMLTDPSGGILRMSEFLPNIARLPFSDLLFRNYFFPGISLFLVNGVTNSLAFILMSMRKKSGYRLASLCGIILMVWMIISFIVMSVELLPILYFLFGLAQLTLGILYGLFRKKDSFEPVTDSDKPENNGLVTLVVFFSRLGYVRKLAYKYADKTDGAVCEIKTVRRCSAAALSRMALLRRCPAIEPIPFDVSAYKRVVLCVQVHAGRISAPMRSFLREYGASINSCEYILVHNSTDDYTRLFDELDTLIGKKRTRAKSAVCRFGSIVCEHDFNG